MLGLMIGLVLVQIVVVALWGIDPARRPLEARTEAPAPAARPAVV